MLERASVLDHLFTRSSLKEKKMKYTIAVIALVLVGLFAYAQVPASLSVLSHVDNTFCVATPLPGNVPSAQVTCRRGGVTQYSAVVTHDTTITSGALTAFLSFDKSKMHFVVVEVAPRSAADVTWPALVVTPPTTSGATRIIAVPGGMVGGGPIGGIVK